MSALEQRTSLSNKAMLLEEEKKKSVCSVSVTGIFACYQ